MNHSVLIQYPSMNTVDVAKAKRILAKALIAMNLTMASTDSTSKDTTYFRMLSTNTTQNPKNSDIITNSTTPDAYSEVMTVQAGIDHLLF